MTRGHGRTCRGAWQYARAGLAGDKKSAPTVHMSGGWAEAPGATLREQGYEGH